MLILKHYGIIKEFTKLQRNFKRLETLHACINLVIHSYGIKAVKQIWTFWVKNFVQVDNCLMLEHLKNKQRNAGSCLKIARKWSKTTLKILIAAIDLEERYIIYLYFIYNGQDNDSSTIMTLNSFVEMT